MSLWKSLFGKKSDQSSLDQSTSNQSASEQSRNDFWVLSYPLCGKIYQIGIDADIMTREEAFGMVRGGIILGNLEASRKEDMVVG